MKKFWVLMLSAVVMITGCTTSFEENKEIIGPSQTAEQWEHQRSVLLDKEIYTSRGVVDIDLLPQSRYGNNNTNTQGQANYVYQAKQNSYVFAVTHFMAGLLFKVKKGDGVLGVEMISTDGQKYNFASEEEFSRLVHIPISRLPYWIMGITLGDEKNIKKDQSGRLHSFENNGWSVNYYEYEIFGEYLLPKRLIVNNPTVGTIKISVEKWEL